MAKTNVQELRAKIAARKQERTTKKSTPEQAQKYAKMRLVAAKAPEKLEKCLVGLADKYASMAEGVENLRENLGLTRAPREASIKTRVAAARNYGKAFKRIAAEAPDKLAEALVEAYNGLNDIATDIEMAAEQMGVDLQSAPASDTGTHDAVDAVSETIESPVPEAAPEMPMETEPEPEEDKEASGSDAWVTDRDESGDPMAPVTAASGTDAFITDRDEKGEPEPPQKVAANKEAMSRKDFILIGDALREFVMPHDQRRRLAEHFAKYLRGTNYNFMSNRFIDYCMGEGGSHGGQYKGAPPQSGDTLFEGVPTQEDASKTRRRPRPFDA